MMLHHLWKIWDQFWFKPKPATPVALYRILYGLLVLNFCYLLYPNLQMFFGARGIVAADSARLWANCPELNVLLIFPGNETLLACLFAALTIAALCLTAGLFTRAAALVVFVALTSLNFRCPFIFNSGDNLLRLGAFFLSLSHAGDAYSLDRLIKGRTKQANSDESGFPPWAQRLLQIQLCLVYAHAFLSKIQGKQWLDGMAVYYALHLDEFQRLPVPFIPESEIACRLLTWSTLAVELAGFTLIWLRPCRYYVLAALVVFHLALDWALNIPQFQWVMIATLVNFVDASDIERARLWLLKRLAREPDSAENIPSV